MKPRRPIKPGEIFNPAIHIDGRKGERRQLGRSVTFEQGGKRVYHDTTWGSQSQKKEAVKTEEENRNNLFQA